MFFKRKNDEIECEVCNSKVNDKYSFCPYCGKSMIDIEQEARDFGLLGKKDNTSKIISNNLGLTDKVIMNVFNSLVKNLDKQFKEIERTEISNIPNGIKIRMGPVHEMKKKPKQAAINRSITEEQITRMSLLPRTEAKSAVRRLSDKIVYELSIPGLQSAQDVFVSKLESGYEIKAIGEKKVYVNSIPINLPIKGYSISENKLMVEFKPQEDYE